MSFNILYIYFITKEAGRGVSREAPTAHFQLSMKHLESQKLSSDKASSLMNLWVLAEHLRLVGLAVAKRFYNAFDLALHWPNFRWILVITVLIVPLTQSLLCLWLLNDLCQWQRHKGIITRHSMKCYQHGNAWRCIHTLWYYCRLKHGNSEVDQTEFTSNAYYVILAKEGTQCLLNRDLGYWWQQVWYFCS